MKIWWVYLRDEAQHGSVKVTCEGADLYNDAKVFLSSMKKKENFTDRSTGPASPVDSALLFGHQGLEVSELEEVLVEVMKVENAHQQEGSGNENPGE